MAAMNRLPALVADARAAGCARLVIDISVIRECPTALTAALVAALGEARRAGIELSIAASVPARDAARVARLADVLPFGVAPDPPGGA